MWCDMFTNSSYVYHTNIINKFAYLSVNSEKLWSTVGCKPSKCKRLDKEEYVTGLVDLVKAKKKKIVAIGETGLDYRPESLRTCRKSNQLK